MAPLPAPSGAGIRFDVFKGPFRYLGGMDGPSWFRHMRSLPRWDMDAVILITGPERMGKSTLAWRLGRLFDHHDAFDAQRMLFTATDYRKTAGSLDRGSVAVLDEMITGGFSRDAMSKDNKKLVKFLIICGERNLYNILILPNMSFVDIYLREHRVRWWIDVDRRGSGLLRVPRRNPLDLESRWVPRLRLNYGPVPKSDPGWAAYLERKSKLVRGDDEDS